MKLVVAYPDQITAMAKATKEVDIERLIAQEASDFIKELEVSNLCGYCHITRPSELTRWHDTFVQVERVLKSFKLK